MGELRTAEQVRAARLPDELPLVRALFEEYATGIDDESWQREFRVELAALPGRYAPPGGDLFLAFAGGAAAGCAALRPHDAECGEIKRLYVRPAARGTGLGCALVERILAAAAEAGYRRLSLSTLPSMRAAISLYRSLGFTEAPPYRDNVPPGALFFGCDLPGKSQLG